MHYPENLAELAAIVRRAREEGKTLVPRSSAPPHIHGASENPAAETVSFERMNRVLKINRHDRYVRVEAGVDFGTLIPMVREAGMRLNTPFMPRAGKSVVASLLERESGILPKYQFDYTDPLLNAEAVFGSGDVFRTGSAAGPGPVEELKADMVTPWGPGTIDYIRFLTAAQGSMGLVSWATMKTELMPTLSKLFFVEAEDAESLILLAAELLRCRVPDDCVILNAVNFAAAFTAGGEEEISVREKAAPWTLVCRVSGYERYPEKRVEIYEGYLRNICAEKGLSPLEYAGENKGLEERIDALLLDCDRGETYWKMRRGAVEELMFLAPPGRAGELVTLAEAQLKSLPAENLGITVQPQVQGRAVRVELDIYHSTGEDEKTARLAMAAAEKLFDAGAFFDRPYGEIAKIVYKEGSTEVETLRKLKKIFDPDGVLNPGKLCF